MTYDEWKLKTPDYFDDEIEEVEEIKEVDKLELAISSLSGFGYYDKINVVNALNQILSYSNEAGINISDVRKFIQTIIETVE